jgi:hypothetical protein
MVAHPSEPAQPLAGMGSRLDSAALWPSVTLLFVSGVRSCGEQGPLGGEIESLTQNRHVSTQG